MTSIASPAKTTPPAPPARNRLRLRLDAPPERVWELVGDPGRMHEYSAGLERVHATRAPNGHCTEYLCVFKPMGEMPAIEHREIVRAYEPGRSWTSVAEEPNAFGLENASTTILVERAGAGTTLTWTQSHNAVDLPASKAGFDEALGDIGANLVARFGGEIVERYVEP